MYYFLNDQLYNHSCPTLGIGGGLGGRWSPPRVGQPRSCRRCSLLGAEGPLFLPGPPSTDTKIHGRGLDAQLAHAFSFKHKVCGSKIRAQLPLGDPGFPFLSLPGLSSLLLPSNSSTLASGISTFLQHPCQRGTRLRAPSHGVSFSLNRNPTLGDDLISGSSAGSHEVQMDFARQKPRSILWLPTHILTSPHPRSSRPQTQKVL